MRALRVAFDARDLTARAQRGMVRYLVGLTAHLPKFGVRVTLFHRARERLNLDHLAGLDCEVVGLQDASAVSWEQIAVPLALARGGFDVYHAPAERGVPLLSPCPVAYTIHSATARSYQDLVGRGLLPAPVSQYLGYDPTREGWNWRAVLARAQTRRAGHYLTVSAFAREELVRLVGLPPQAVSVTPLAVPPAFARPRNETLIRRVCERYGLRPPYLLYVGGFEPHKNVAGLIPVLRHVRRQIPGLSLVIVGTGSVPALLRSGVAAAGFVPGRDVVFLSDLGEELTSVYDAAAAFVSVSWRETFGVPFLEAMARGVPVVASSWGAATEVVADAGELVEPQDGEATAAAILKVMGEADRYAAAGRARAQSFTWERTACETAAVYRRLARVRTK